VTRIELINLNSLIGSRGNTCNKIGSPGIKCNTIRPPGNTGNKLVGMEILAIRQVPIKTRAMK
jgi:hypothetical protein